MAVSVWEQDLEVLEATAQIEGQWGTNLEALADHLESDPSDIGRSVRRLWDDDYLTASDASTLEGFDAISIRLLGKGRRIIGQWPNEDALFRELVEQLEDRARSETDPKQKAALERAKDGLQAAGASTVGSVLGALARHLIGI